MGQYSTLECIDELGSTWSHVVRNNDVGSICELGERNADRIGDVCIKLIGHYATNVISLNNCIEIWHGCRDYSAVSLLRRRVTTIHAMPANDSR